MRKSILMTIALTFLMSSMALAADVKIGVLNVEGIIAQSAYGKKSKAKIEAKVKKFQADMKKSAAAIDKMQKEMREKASVLSDDAKRKKLQQYQQKAQAYQKKRADAQMALQKAEQDIFKPVLELLIKVTQDYAKKNGYTLILNAKNTILYATPKYDLTKAILGEFNKKAPK